MPITRCRRQFYILAAFIDALFSFHDAAAAVIIMLYARLRHLVATGPPAPFLTSHGRRTNADALEHFPSRRRFVGKSTAV